MKINFEWVSRLGKVVLIMFSLIFIPISFLIASESLWGLNLSSILFLTAGYLLISYLILILITKTILYIAAGRKFLKSGFKKIHYVLLLIPIALLIFTGLLFGIIIEPVKEEGNSKEIEKKYNEAVLKIDSLRSDFKECAQPVLNEKYEEQLRSCNLKRNKIKHDYDFCVSLYSINSPASCLYDHDYESIDCSEDTVRKQSELLFSEYDLDVACKVTYKELKAADLIIKMHESSLE